MMSLWDALRMNMMISYQELVRTFPNKTPAISKLELVLDIYPSLSLILRYIYCLVFQGASSGLSPEAFEKTLP